MFRARFAGRVAVLILVALGITAPGGDARAGDPPADSPPPPYPPAPGTDAVPPASPAQQQPPPPPTAVRPLPSPYSPAPAPGAYPPRPGTWTPRPTPTLPSEPGLAAGQLTLGTLTTVAAFALLASVQYGTGGDDSGPLFLLAVPAATGLVVCAVGRRSDWYRGGCASAVVGAYLGMLSAFPLALAGCLLGGGTGDNDCLEGAIVGLVIGIFLGPAVGATVGWHLFKEPRADLGYILGPPPTAARERVSPSSAWGLVEDSATGRRAQRTAAAVRLSVPLLSIAF